MDKTNEKHMSKLIIKNQLYGRREIYNFLFLIFYSSIDIKSICRAVARSGLIVLGGENVPSLVEIGLTGLPKTGGAGA